MRNSFNSPAGYAGKDTGIPRRKLLAAGAALPLVAIRTRPANAAEFTYKLATGQDPMHPVNKRSQEAIDRIREATGGRLEIRLFPANQLGSNSDLLGQVRNGGVEFFDEASSILTTLVPAAGLLNIGLRVLVGRPSLRRAADAARPLRHLGRGDVAQHQELAMTAPVPEGRRSGDDGRLRRSRVHGPAHGPEPRGARLQASVASTCDPPPWMPSSREEVSGHRQPPRPARGADVLVLMVVDAAQAEAVLFAGGALEALSPDGIVALMATCPPGAVEPSRRACSPPAGASSMRPCRAASSARSAARSP